MLFSFEVPYGVYYYTAWTIGPDWKEPRYDDGFNNPFGVLADAKNYNPNDLDFDKIVNDWSKGPREIVVVYGHEPIAQGNPPPIPEPSTLLLLGVGFTGLVVSIKQGRRKKIQNSG